jgi:hypothetical protein
MINNTVTIKTPLINPKQTPHRRSIHPKKATFSKYLITTPRILIIMRTLQKITKKLKMFRYAGLIINPERGLATTG